MSYWGNTFMPTVDSVANPMIKHFAEYTSYSEDFLRSVWNGLCYEAGQEACGNPFEYVDKVCDQLKYFIGVTLELDW